MVHRPDTVLNIAAESRPKRPQLILHSFSMSLFMLETPYFETSAPTNSDEDIPVFLFAP